MPKQYHQGLFTPVHPEKYEGDPTMICYRSSWELKTFKWCDLNPSVLKWSSEEIRINYICATDNRRHTYFPDLKIKMKTKSGEIKTYLVEIKPLKETMPPKRKSKYYLSESLTYIKNQSKWKYAKEYCKDRGWEFIVLTEQDLGLTGSR